MFFKTKLPQHSLCLHCRCSLQRLLRSFFSCSVSLNFPYLLSPFFPPFLALCNNYRLPGISAHPFRSSAATVQHTLLTFAFCAVGRAMEIQKLRHPKHLSAPSSMSPELQDPAKLRQSGVANEGTDTGYLPASSMSSATSGAALSQEGGRENDTGEP